MQEKCNICGNKIFSKNNNKNRWCTICHSGERHRAFIEEYEKNIKNFCNLKNKKILFFSPNNGVLNYMKNNDIKNVISTNIIASNDIDIVLNIEDMNSIKNEEYDCCILFHVLCVVKYDILALNELNRITKKNGYIFINDCVNSVEKSYQNNKLNSGHYRTYGKKNFTNLLNQYFDTIILNMIDPVIDSCYPKSLLFCCKKINNYKILNKKYSV